MKKQLLTGLFLASAFFASAQIKATGPGAFARDNFSTLDPVYDNDLMFGIFYFKDTINTSITYDSVSTTTGDPGTYPGVFAVAKERLGDGKQTYTITQSYGKYEPTGVTFGEGNSIDLTGGKSVGAGSNLTARVTLKSIADSSLRFKFALADVNNNQYDSKGPGRAAGVDVWKDEFLVIVPKGGLAETQGTNNANTGLKVTNNSDGSFTVDLDFSNGYKVDYDNGAAILTNFDSTKVNALLITAVSGTRNADEDFKPYKLIQQKFELLDVTFGDYANAVLVGVQDEVIFGSDSKLAVRPNPATGGVVEFNKNVENVRIFDTMGKLVFSAASATKVNVSSFTKGVYVAQTSKGATRFVVE
jgi:hypothetical protein